MDDSEDREDEVDNEAEEPREEKLRYDTVPFEPTPEEDLYAYRDALPGLGVQQQQVVAVDGKPAVPAAPFLDKRKQKVLLALATIGCLGLAIIAILTLNKGPPPPPYVDLGTSSVANSGLSGDLVARWTGKANYLFYVNPLSSDDVTGFAAVAANPPRQIMFT